MMFENCKRCDLHCNRKQVVAPYIQYNRKNGVDILFVTSSPTASGNVLGTSITYQDSKVYRQMLDAALDMNGKTNKDIGFAVLSLVLCVTKQTWKKATPPTPAQVLSCRSNFFYWVDFLRPSSVVFASDEVKRYLKKEFPDARTIVDPTLVMVQGIRSSSWFVYNSKICQEAMK